MKRLLLLAGLAISCQTHASTPFVDQWFEQPQAFTLELRKLRQSLNSQWELQSQSLYAELAYLHSPYLHISMVASKEFDRIQGTQQQDLDGYQGGLLLRAISPTWHQLQAALTTGYRFHQSERDESQAAQRLRRHIWQLDGALQWRLGKSVGAYVGLGLEQQSSQLRLDGTQYLLSEMIYQHQILGLDLEIEAGGHVGLEFKQGDLKGFALYFQHRY